MRLFVIGPGVVRLSIPVRAGTGNASRVVLACEGMGARTPAGAATPARH